MSEENPRPSRKLLIISSGIAAAVICVVLFNWVSVFGPNRAILAQDSSKGKVSVWTYYSFGVFWPEVVYDVRYLDPTAAPVDVTRVLFKFAGEMQDRSFSRIYLSYHGRVRYTMDGNDFREIGREYTRGDPMLALRTMPEKLYSPDGRHAFQSWSGGLIGVLSQQLEDLNSFYRSWFSDDA